PNSTHEAASKRAMRYLAGMTSMGITFGGTTDLIIEGYSDADHADGEDRKSISGFVFMLGGGAISWMSKKQCTVALSSTEAEYMALLQAVKENIWIQQLLNDLNRTA